MRIAALTIAYNEEQLITGCIECLKPFVEEHIVLISDKPYFGEAEKPDKTKEIAESLGAGVVNGQWSLDHHQRNTGIAFLQDYDWIICTDADMWFTKKDAAGLILLLNASKKRKYVTAFIINQIAYWRDIDHVLINDDFQPVIAVKPSVRFRHIGTVNCPICIVPKDVSVVHHINWCEPKDVWKKITTYPHAPEIENKKRWYKHSYLGWKEGEDAVLPDKKLKVVKQSLPDELKQYIIK